MKSRLLAWLSVESCWALLGIAACCVLLVAARGRGAGPGDVVSLAVTVVPADAKTLECDLRPTSAIHCAFADGKPSDAAGTAAKPFVSVDGELVILSGVFESPAVHEWLESARRARSSERVTLRCQVLFEGMLRDVGVRFSPSSPFEKHASVMGGSVRTCKVAR